MMPSEGETRRDSFPSCWSSSRGRRLHYILHFIAYRPLLRFRRRVRCLHRFASPTYVPTPVPEPAAKRCANCHADGLADGLDLGCADSTPFHSIPSYSTTPPRHAPVRPHSIPFHSISFHSIICYDTTTTRTLSSSRSRAFAARCSSIHSRDRDIFPAAAWRARCRRPRGAVVTRWVHAVTRWLPTSSARRGENTTVVGDNGCSFEWTAVDLSR